MKASRYLLKQPSMRPPPLPGEDPPIHLVEGDADHGPDLLVGALGLTGVLEGCVE